MGNDPARPLMWAYMQPQLHKVALVVDPAHFHMLRLA